VLRKVAEHTKTKQGSALIGIAGLALAYIVISLAIDSGSLMQYALAFVLLYLTIGSLARFIRLSIMKTYGKRPRSHTKKA
jgi:hypothetical protein